MSTLDDNHHSIKSSVSWLNDQLRQMVEERTSLAAQLTARWRLILCVFLVSSTVGIIGVLQLPRTYTAEAVMILDSRRNQILDGLASLNMAQLDAVAINNEVNLFYLPELALKV